MSRKWDLRRQFADGMRAGDTDLVRRLIEESPELRDGENIFSTTCLNYAAKYCSSSVIDLMLSLGFDINAPDKCHITALEYAIDSGRVVVVESLIARGASSGPARTLGGYGEMGC